MIGDENIEHEKDDQMCPIPILALDQDDRSCIQEILAAYTSVAQRLPPSQEKRTLLGTLRRLSTKLEMLAAMQGEEALDIDVLENHALYLAFVFYMHAIPLLHLDPAQEQDLLKEVKQLQAYLRVEHVALPEKSTFQEGTLKE